jgi:hypothetical protein
MSPLCSPFFRALAALMILVSVPTFDARAATRNAVFIVEEPYSMPDAPPSSEQVQRGLEVHDRLSERILQLHLDGIILSDGRSAIEPPLASLFEGADLVIQIKTFESSLGFRVDAQIFDKAQQKWVQVVRKSFEDEAALVLEAAIAKAIIPPVLVRALELAQPADRPVIFADCLISGDTGIAGRIFSARFISVWARLLLYRRRPARRGH